MPGSGRRASASARACQRRVIEIGIDVAADGDEDLARAVVFQQRQRLHDPAGGFQRLLLGRIAQLHAPARTVAERGFDPLAEPRVIDHDGLKTGVRQPFDLPHDQRLAAGFEQAASGYVSVSGRMRSPRPAAKIIAFFRGSSSSSVRRCSRLHSRGLPARRAVSRTAAAAA